MVPGHAHLSFLRSLGLAGILVLPAPAQRVVVTPGQRTFYASTSALGSPGERDRFQFHATLEGAADQPRQWQWRLVDPHGEPPVDAGTLTQEGLYTPPLVSLARFRLVQVQATAVGVRLPSGAAPTGTALAVIRPAAGLRQALEHGGHPAAPGHGERVEPLAPDLLDGPEPDVRGPDLGESPAQVVHMPRLPRPGRGDPVEAWLVAVEDRVLGIAPDGQVSLLAQAGPGVAPIPQFTWLAARPWDGTGGEAWEAVLWDQRGGALWRLDSAGRLAPWAAAPFRRTGPDAARDDAGLARLEGLAMDRAGRVYTLLRRSPGHGRPASGQVVRIDPDGTPTPLSGAATGRDGSLERAAGLALAPDGQALYCLDLDPKGARLVRIALPDGTARVIRLDLPPYRGTLRGLGFHRDQLVLAGVEPAAFFQVDPGSGQGRRIYRDALRSGDHPDDDLPLRPGPCYHSGRLREHCGSLGSGFQGAFAVDGQGRIAVLSGGQAGLLVLDWDRPGTKEGRGGSVGDDPAGRPAGGARQAKPARPAL